jgi:hypothetical protein
MPSRRAASGGRVTPADKTSRASRVRNDNHNTTPDDGMFRDARSAKKRKLEIRPGPKQQTLDNLGFFNRAAATTTATPVQPPVRITVAEPHGQLIETVNGVRAELESEQDDTLVEDDGDVMNTPSKPVAAHTKEPKPEPTDQPAGKRKKEERRSLRSRDDGPKLKSELAGYFANYEDIMFDTPAEPEFITVDSAIYITDDAPKVAKAQTPSPRKNNKQSKGTPGSARSNGTRPFSSHSSPVSYNGCQVVDLSTFLKAVPDKPDDPLSEDAFLKSHKRAERKEKQLRNIERERAMHEKFQLDRLLEGLQGHDWLKVLGVTGVTDGEAKRYEPKRDYFIAEVQALVDKFQEWKDEEKRQRLEREAALAAEREAEEEEEDDDSDGLSSSSETSPDPPSSDLNASAARQLQQETASALKSSSKQANSARNKPPSTQRDSASIVPPPPPIPYRPPSPITSFYDKRHMRDAALKKTRHGRSVTAFGQPLPEPEEREFELPADYVTAEVLKARGREWRRRKRESVANAAGK